MAYQSLYRRYRSQKFSEIVGQSHVTTGLRSAVAEGRQGHAYLFSGPRGTGKTSTARILAKALNCPNVADGEPCGTCESCQAIEHGSSFDLHELDAASHNKVDDIRDLISRVNLGSPGRTKVYILDEVHMLSSGAENALLKTLEEPPDHVVFVLATTEPHKVVSTIRSRTQHFAFHLLPADELAEHVRWIIDDAGLDVDDEAIDYVLAQGGGSARDTLSALDLVVAAGGVPSGSDVGVGLTRAIGAGDAPKAIAAIQEGLSIGQEPRTIGEATVEILRNAFLAAMGAPLDHLNDRTRELVTELAASLGPATLTRALEGISGALVEMRQAPDPRVPLEVAVLRLCRGAGPAPTGDAPADALSPATGAGGKDAALAARVTELERQLAELIAQLAAGGSNASAGAPTSTPTDRDTNASAGAPSSTPTDRDTNASAGAPSSTPTDRDTNASADASSSTPTDRDTNASADASSSTPTTSEPDAAAGASDPPTQARAADGPAAAARGRLAAAKAPPSPRARGGKPDAPADASDASTTAPEGPTAAADPSPQSEPPAGADGTSRPALTTAPTLSAVNDAFATCLEGVSQKTRVRFKGGRILDVEGSTVIFGVPNQIHRDRCHDLKAEVEQALGRQLGHDITLNVAVDGDAPTPTMDPARIDTKPDDEPADDDDDIGPVEELADATDQSANGVERLTKAFPGSKVIESPPGQDTP